MLASFFTTDFFVGAFYGLLSVAGGMTIAFGIITALESLKKKTKKEVHKALKERWPK